jgi:lipopolysaccharide transport system ATP-binding protein
MSHTVIEIQNLSKQYRLGQLHHGTNSIREQITQSCKNLFSKIRYNTSSQKNSDGFQTDGSKLESPALQNNNIWALKNITLNISQGEIIGIIGNNGAGKSTLLKILSRITKPTVGKAIIRGRVGSLLEVGTGFHPELTGRENIFLNGSILGMKKNEIRENFEEIVNFANIEKFIDTPVKRYSSGMYVRLAFSVAAHLQSEIIFVDEVLAVGDIAFQKKCLGKIQNIANIGRTVVFVSHNMSSIRNLCNRVLWLDNGRIRKSGASDEIIRSYEINQIVSEEATAHTLERDLDTVTDRSFFIRRVEIQNTKGELTNVVPYNHSLVLLLRFGGSPIKTKFGVEFKIYKSSGEFACTGTSGFMHGTYFDKSHKSVKIDIGPLTLSSGMYNIVLSIMYGEIRCDTWVNACSFHIIECLPFALPQEIKTPVCVIPHTFSHVE